MTATAELSRPNQNAAISKPTTIKGWLQSGDFKRAVAQALPKHVSADRFLRAGLTALTRTPKLAECTQESFLQAMLTLSQMGLEPDGRRAHLIPFENRKKGCVEVQLIVDYKGLAELVLRSGVVSYLHADIVCENDEFEHDKGEIKHHKIDLRKPRGAVYAAYALCRFKDGSEKAEVMSRDEVEAIRKRSRAGNSGPWVTDWNEMSKKTVFRRLSKWLPLSAEIREAVEADDDQFIAPEVHVSEMPAGESKSDQLADVLSAGIECESGNDSGLNDSGEQSQVSSIEASGGNGFSEKGAALVHKINEASGNYDALCNLMGDVVALYKSKTQCDDPEGHEVYRLIDEKITESKPKKR